VYVAGVLLPNVDGKHLSTYPIVGYLGNEILNWTLEGRYGITFGPHKLDLVAEWREPVTREVTVYLYSDGDVSLMPYGSAIASTRVTLTEGVFAEGKP
jgi:hypothetical protein